VKDAILVTATDTEVGKTVVTAALVRALRLRGFSAVGMKPFATGCRRQGADLVSEDAEHLEEACEFEVEGGLICPVRYAEPVAPAVAARMVGRPVDVEAALDAVEHLATRYDFLVLEGIGGLAVPVTDELTVADFARRLGLDILVVARRTLGTLNHTELTVSYARAGGLNVRGIVLTGAEAPRDDISVATNTAEIERLTGQPVLGAIPALAPGTPTEEVILAAVAHLAPQRNMRI